MKKSKFLSKLSTLFLAVNILFVFCFGGIQIATATETPILRIHYKRFDDNYENWNLWVWEFGKEGKGVNFTGTDDYGVYLDVQLNKNEMPEKVGFIVRYGDWEKKDISMDRFVSITSDKTDVYILQGDQNVYSKKEDVDLSPKILKAGFVKNNQIEFNVTKPIDVTDTTDTLNYKVFDKDNNEYKIKKIWVPETGDNTSVTVIMDGEMDLGKSYYLEIKDYGKISIDLSGGFDKIFDKKYYYSGDDLGALYSKACTKFRVWAPTATQVKLNIYDTGEESKAISQVDMMKDVNGTWVHTSNEDLLNKFYTYSVTVDENEQEAVDPYARAVGINSKRGMIVDLANTNPQNWEKDKRPDFANYTDAVIYELHVRDMSMDSSSGIKNKGKFLGLVEENTKTSNGTSTGLAHLKDLGITHLHLLPSFDYRSVDEKDSTQFNWGYDPQHYNTPEGSYSTDAFDGNVRITEFKEMVKKLHDNGIRVIMDVVYNHTGATADSDFNKIVPNYYYRKDANGYCNGSGCGNETASERAMVRKFIVDSVKYWATEYHIDGFRFDLMGLHDIETMNMVREELNKIDESILVYGEGWTGGLSPLPDFEKAQKINASKLNDVAMFNDDIRDGIKGHVFNDKEKGFATGAIKKEEQVKFGIVGAITHPQVMYTKGWAKKPSQSINYVSAHDNLTLWDKLNTSNSDDDVETLKKMNKLAASIVYTSQGIPFMQAGEEFLRSKPTENGFDSNSYKSSDEINSLKWSEKEENIDIYNYYKGLIEFRKNHNILRLNTAEEVIQKLNFDETVKENVVAYRLSDDKEDIIVIHNANKETIKYNLPKGKWDMYINGDFAGNKVLSTHQDSIDVEGISTVVLVEHSTKMMYTVLIAGILFVVVVCVVILFIKKENNSKIS